MQVHEIDFMLPVWDGDVIHGTTWSEDDGPKAQVLIARGRSEYGKPHSTNSLCHFDPTAASRALTYADADRTAEPAAHASVHRGLPIALVTDDRDPVKCFLEWLDPRAACYRRWDFADASTFICGGARHERINQTNRDEVTAHLIDWFDRVTKPCESELWQFRALCATEI